MAKNRKMPDMNLPVWFDGQNINEALFCEEFLHERKIIFTNRAFFTPEGRVTDDIFLRSEVYEKLKSYTISSVPQKIKNIMELLKLEAMAEDFPPQPDRIHVANGTPMLDGRFAEGKTEIVQSRLPVSYNPNAPAPVLWLNFLDGLLYSEDIPTLQEFIGYCLIPSNKGQRMMVIKGNGGEGKSQIGAVLSTIFGTNMKDGSIGKISENRFARADLEHILLCVDDDNNIFDFMNSEGYIRRKADASISSKDFYEIYRMWCEENSLAPLKARSFSDAMIANAKKFDLEHCNNITNFAGRRVWGFMGVEAVARPHINGFYDVSPCTYVPEEWRD